MNNKPLILLVDDEQEILDLYTTVLNNAGLETITALNGQECLDKVKGPVKPDLILLDLKMPVMDGIETLAKLKENPQTKDIKVVFLTAFSDPVFVGIDQKFAKSAGAIDFVKKGISLNELVEKIKGYLKE